MSKPPREQQREDMADESLSAACSILERVTGETLPRAKNPAAVALGKLGASKGGKARAEKLSAERKSEIAKRGAQERWGRGEKLKP